MRESLYLEDNDHLVEVLKKIPAFQPIRDDSIRKLLRLSKIRIFEPSERIIREGESEKGMYLLISGAVTITKNKKPIAALKRTGDIFGEMSLLEEGPRSATVTATTETTCLLVDSEYLETLDADGKNSFHAAIYHMFAEILAYRLRITTENYTKTRLELEQLKKTLR